MIRLDFFTKEDVPQLIDWIHDEHILANWAGGLFRFPLNERNMDWYIEDSNDLEKSDVLIYKAVDTNTHKTVGHISLGSINRYDGSARISRVLVGNTEVRGRGICQHMVKAILKIAFEQLQLHRISLGVYDFNTSAINCYKKSGLIVEGVMRDVKKMEGKFWSLVEMSILEDEWRELQSNKK